MPVAPVFSPGYSPAVYGAAVSSAADAGRDLRPRRWPTARSRSRPRCATRPAAAARRVTVAERARGLDGHAVRASLAGHGRARPVASTQSFQVTPPVLRAVARPGQPAGHGHASAAPPRAAAPQTLINSGAGDQVPASEPGVDVRQHRHHRQRQPEPVGQLRAASTASGTSVLGAGPGRRQPDAGRVGHRGRADLHLAERRRPPSRTTRWRRARRSRSPVPAPPSVSWPRRTTRPSRAPARSTTPTAARRRSRSTWATSGTRPGRTATRRTPRWPG